MIELSAITQTILHALLDQAEQPDRQRVIRVRINQKHHADYFSAHNVAPRRAANRDLSRLEAQGLVRLHWKKWEEDNWLQAVDLIDARVADIYALLRREPRADQNASLLELLDRQQPIAPWFASFIESIRARLDSQHSIAPLKLEDPQWNSDLLRALDGLSRLAEPTLERVFSVRLFADSKRFNTLRPAVLRILRHHDLSAAAYGDDDAALLRAHMLDSVPEYIPIAGPLWLSDQNARISLEPFRPSVALSAAMLRHAEVERCLASKVVTIENSTNFSHALASRPATVLLVYTGGFASPTVIGLLRRIRAIAPDLEFQHWGDIDAGGLRILAHLRRELGDIEPMAMDTATFEQYRAHAQALTPNDRKALSALAQSADLADCRPLINHLLATGLKLEQEAVISGSAAIAF